MQVLYPQKAENSLLKIRITPTYLPIPIPRKTFPFQEHPKSIFYGKINIYIISQYRFFFVKNHKKINESFLITLKAGIKILKISRQIDLERSV